MPWKETMAKFLEPPPVRGVHTPKHIKNMMKKLRKVWRDYPQLTLSELLAFPFSSRTHDDELLIEQLEQHAKHFKAEEAKK